MEEMYSWYNPIMILRSDIAGVQTKAPPPQQKPPRLKPPWQKPPRQKPTQYATKATHIYIGIYIYAYVNV